MSRLGVVACAALLLCVGFGFQQPAWSQPVEPPTTLPVTPPPAAYYIQPRDVLDVRVFGEPELSVSQLPVDSVGNLMLPLIGEVKASGRTAGELTEEIRGRLTRYIITPQVTVLVTTPQPRQVIVEGQVMQPGIYDLPQTPTLLSSIAQARGPTRIAKLRDIFIMRQIDGHRYAARFDLVDIRKGLLDDPEVLPNDRVLVGMSVGKAIFRDFLTVAPLLTAVFVRLD